MGKELPLGIEDLVNKRLSWEKNQGTNGRIRTLAQQIFEFRIKFGIPGDSLSDWLEAEQIVKLEFINIELVGHPKLARGSNF